jgi:hypothetical protein
MMEPPITGKMDFLRWLVFLNRKLMRGCYVSTVGPDESKVRKCIQTRKRMKQQRTALTPT